MRVSSLYVLFFILTTVLMISTIIYVGKAYKVNRSKLIVIKSRIQEKSQKEYPKRRKVTWREYSLELAQEEIEKVLEKEPIVFKEKGNLIENSEEHQPLQVNSTKVVLNKILKILNHLEEDAILSIVIHTHVKATPQENLVLSQKEADALKNYFREKSTIPLIVAIGYGEELPMSKKREKESRNIEINLKRIK